MQGKNALRSLGLEPVNLDTFKFKKDKTSQD
jgi:hypothetical protein